VSARSVPAPQQGSPLGRRNPTVKLGLLFLVSLVLLFVFDPITPAVLYLLGLAAVIVFTRMAWRALLLAHVPFLGFALGLLIVNALSRPGGILWESFPLRVTVEGLVIGASLGLRSLAIGVLSIAFLASTDAVSLMTSLNQHARLSPRLTYAVLAGYRMLQEMPREWRTIRQAHEVRAPLRADGSPARGPRQLLPAAFTLLVVSLRKGERMAAALESRGLGLSPRTTWRPVPLVVADWAMAAGVLVVLALLLGAGVVLGYEAGPSALFS
jgi:energy-coupling factor transport system permease protein